MITAATTRSFIQAPLVGLGNDNILYPGTTLQGVVAQDEAARAADCSPYEVRETDRAY